MADADQAYRTAGLDASVSPRVDQRQKPGRVDRLVRFWVNAPNTLRVAISQARRSPTVAVRRGLQIGLPVTAVLVALNPIWGFSWYFNTENWATEAVGPVGRAPDRHLARADGAGGPRAVSWHNTCRTVSCSRWYRKGSPRATDFSFVVIGDPGEGDASQHVLRDQFLELGQRPDVKFLVLASDVIYPAGAMKDYEVKFYLPFKGFTKPDLRDPGQPRLVRRPGSVHRQLP